MMTINKQKKPIIAIILYNANQTAYERIRAAIGDGYEFYIFDNSPDDNSKSFIDEYKCKIRYFTFNHNVGLARALKVMCSAAYEEGQRYLLYFDQDTIYNKETLDYIYGYIDMSAEAITSNHDRKILSVTFRDSAVKRKVKNVQKMAIGKYELHMVDFTINSGTLFFLKTLKEVGWHNESYEIDGVDYYICLAARAAGLKVAEIYNTPSLDHDTEQGYRKYKFLFKRYYGRKYPAYRIKNYCSSLLKLIVKGAGIDVRLTFKILKLLISYLLMQGFIYLSREG